MQRIEKIFETARAQGRSALSETETYDVFDILGLPTPMRSCLPPDGVARHEAHNILESLPGEKVVLKVSSPSLLHKTEAGGVKVCAKDKVMETVKQMASAFPQADGILICEFIDHAVFALGQELLLGARADAAFGPIITLGVGGTDAEGLTSKLKPGLSPAIAPLAFLRKEADYAAFVNGAWIWKYVSGNVRGGKKLAQDCEIIRWLKAFAELMAYFSDGGKSAWAVEEVEANPLAVSCGRLVALDGVLRFRPARKAERIPPSRRAVRALLSPATAAVAGVSSAKMNMGRIILGNIMAAGFPKKNLYVLKNHDGEIDGVRCFPSAKKFPKTVDMLVVSVPGPEVPVVLRDAAESGKVRGVVLISGGMGEKEGSGKLAAEVLKIIEAGRKKNPDFALSGGNSLGIVSNPAGLNTLFIPAEKMRHPIGETPGMAKTAFISQSGAFVIAALSKMPYLKPVYSVSVGNQMDVTVADYVDEVCREDKIKAVLVYVEGLKEGDGLRLARAISAAVSAGKEVVVYKAGRTCAGQKAVMGHTASIAGDYVVAQSVLSKAGAHVAGSFDEFEDLAELCGFLAGKKPSGRGVFLISNAGFETAGMADNLAAKGPLSLVVPDEKLARGLARGLKKSGLDAIVDVRNPLDLTPMASDEAIFSAAKEALLSDSVSALVVSSVPLTPAMKTLPSEGLEDALPAKLGRLAKESGKPVVFCVSAGELYAPYRDSARQAGLPVFESADRAVRALSAFFR